MPQKAPLIRTHRFTLLVLAAVLSFAIADRADAQLLHLWDFESGSELIDSAGGLNLITAPGEGQVMGVMGTAGDIVFEAGYNGVGQAYRPYYVDSSMSSTAGAGLTGSGFTTPNQFTIETIVKADTKTSGSAVNYIFQTRPGSDRGYFLIQDEDNLGLGSVGGIGSIVGNNFGDVGIGAEYDSSGEWIYYALVIDMTSTPGMAVADVYSANLSDGETTPTLVLNNRTWNTANPSSLAGASGIFGIGDFAIDRNGDTIAEASQEWFQGAIDYISIYNGLLTPQQLEDNLTERLTRSVVPTPAALPAGLVMMGLLAGRRRRRG